MFRDKTGGLRKTLKNLAELVYCEAPHILPQNEETTQEAAASSVDSTQKAWWFKSRDFHQRNLAHFKEDIEKTLNCVNEVFERLGPFDGVWGFSMGGELATLLTKICLENQNLNENSLYKNIEFKFVIITASSKSSETYLDSYYDLDKKFAMSSLHVIGKADKLVPHERAIDLTYYFVNPQTYVHELGHFIPNNPESKKIYIEFLKEILDKILQGKTL
jgi:hypothetical protein